LPSRDWGSGGSSVSGGLSNWGGGGEWSSSGWHETVGNNSSAGKIGIESKRNGQSVVQVVEGHVVKDFSEEVSINFTVVSCAGALFGISKIGILVSSIA